MSNQDVVTLPRLPVALSLQFTQLSQTHASKASIKSRKPLNKTIGLLSEI